jgi:hypothetical protein
MAGKLQPEEVRVIINPVEKAQPPPSGAKDDVFMRQLNAQCDTALLLSPESGAWFGYEVVARTDY